MTNIDPSALVGAMHGPKIVIPTSLIMQLGLETAVYLQQAAYLTALSKKKNGWFNLRQTGLPSSNSTNLFQSLGSFESCTGIKKNAQNKIRAKLVEMQLLSEVRKGIPARTHYKVNLDRYLQLLAGTADYNPEGSEPAIEPNNMDKEHCIEHADVDFSTSGMTEMQASGSSNSFSQSIKFHHLDCTAVSNYYKDCALEILKNKLIKYTKSASTTLQETRISETTATRNEFSTVSAVTHRGKIEKQAGQSQMSTTSKQALKQLLADYKNTDWDASVDSCKTENSTISFNGKIYPCANQVEMVNVTIYLLSEIIHSWYGVLNTESIIQREKLNWKQALSSQSLLHGEAIQRGLSKALISDNRYWPNSGVFAKWCMVTPEEIGAPSVHQAINEAVKASGLPEAERYKSKYWSHPIVYHAAKIFGFQRLYRTGEIKAFSAFKENYNILIFQASQGKTFEYPSIKAPCTQRSDNTTPSFEGNTSRDPRGLTYLREAREMVEGRQ